MGVYLIFINLLALGLMLADKRRAEKGHWRIAEATLLLVAAAGGSLGTLLGMRLARHKTRKAKFVILVPLMFAVQIYILYRMYI